MKAGHWIIAAAALACAEPVQAGLNDPETLIYRVPAVYDDGGGSFAGEATLFSCTNFSGVTENIRFVTRDFDGTLKTNHVFTVNHLTTRNAGTHPIANISANTLDTGFVSGGTTAIAATSINIICTAMIIDATGALTHGVALRGIRFNPAPGSQE